jgi:hypothetical protein
MEETPILAESVSSSRSTRGALDLAAGLVAWLVFAAVGAAAFLAYAAFGGSGAETWRGEVELLIGFAAAFWLGGAWMTISWWVEGRTRLWALPLVLTPISVFLFIPFYLVFCSAGVRRAVLPSPPDSQLSPRQPRFLGLSLWAFPLALAFWLFAFGTFGVSLLLLFIPGVRRTVLPRRRPTG